MTNTNRMCPERIEDIAGTEDKFADDIERAEKELEVWVKDDTSKRFIDYLKYNNEQDYKQMETLLLGDPQYGIKMGVLMTRVGLKKELIEYLKDKAKESEE